jgi:hypothetical protein
VPFVRQMLREGGKTATSVVASDPG